MKENNVEQESVNLKSEESSQNKKGLIIKIIISIIIVLIVVIFGRFAYDKLKDNESVSGVRKLLSAKYTSITCIDLDCNGFVAIDGNKLLDYKVLLYNSKGNKVADYKVKYNKKSNTTEVPIDIAYDFYISSKTSVKNSLDVKSYAIKNKNNKTVFESKNKLKVLNDNLVTMSDNQNITLLNKKGKKLYSNISNLEDYIYGKYIQIKIDDKYIILDEQGEKILENYKISKMVKDDNNREIFAIIKNMSDNTYNYYDLRKNKVVGDSFSSYTQNTDSLEFIITKKENNKNIEYLLKKNGKQEKIDDNFDEIKNKIDDKLYKLYSKSIYKSNQKNVFVDNLKDRSFGVLDLKSNRYTEVYKYKSDKDYFLSVITEIGKESYFKISCPDRYCSSKSTLIYDIDNKKILYKSNSDITSYLHYKDDYKIVKFYLDDKYKSNYVVFDKNNEELLISETAVVIVDKDLILGKEPDYLLTLYSAKNNKVLKKKDVSSMTILQNKIYKYKDSDENTLILNSKGKKRVKVKKDGYLKFSINSYVYLNDDKVNIYNIEKDKTYKYKLKENEKLNLSSGRVISPYRNIIFINNSVDDYVKIINFKADKIKKIDNVQISSINKNEKENKAYIIIKKKDSYGLYVAE